MDKFTWATGLITIERGRERNGGRMAMSMRGVGRGIKGTGLENIFLV
jgi:hypothetical protein